MMEENNQVLLSWISNYMYCPRRFYLAVLESQQIGSNVYVEEGSAEHKRVHTPKVEKRGDFYKVTGLSAVSIKYNMYGVCDSVEFEASPNGTYISFLNRVCNICPVEYKHGKVRKETEYNAQLAAQAICLEEMYHTHIQEGIIYYVDVKQRERIIFDDELREKTLSAVAEMQDLLKKPEYIAPKYKKRCQKCAYYEVCAPKKIITSKYMEKLWSKE